MSARNGIILAGCVIMLGCFACIGFVAAIAGGVWFLVAPVSEAGDNFLIEVKEGDFATAYTMCSASLQDEFGSAEGLQTFFAQYAPTIQHWNFTSRNLENGRGTLLGSVELQDGEERDIELYLDQEDGEWKITGIRIN